LPPPAPLRAILPYPASTGVTLSPDIHVSKDSQLILFHDPDLRRTTGSPGLIRQRNWFGPDGIEHLRTVKEPSQPIPTFKQTLALLLEQGNRHITFNVDVKVYNDPQRLFSLMHQTISDFPNWETDLVPRILLGLWHPSFLKAAMENVPYLKRSHIGQSPYIAREFFWDGVDAFSMNFGSLCTQEGERFRKECQAAGKKLMVWTVNSPDQMMEAVRWQADAIITDVTKVWLDLRKALTDDYKKAAAPFDGPLGRLFLWTTPMFFTPMQVLRWNLQKTTLEKAAGVMEKVSVVVPPV